MSRKFNIIKKQNLPDEAKIVGFSFLKEPTDKDRKNKKFDFIEYSDMNEIGCMLPKRKAFGYTKGYVQIDDKVDTFVEVKSRLLIIILLCGLLLGALALPFIGGHGSDIIDDLPIIGDIDISDEQHTRPVETKPKEEIPTITFAGYGKYKVTENYPSVELKNPEINFVDMVFTLTDEASGEIIARTGKVPAGKYAYVNVMDFYTEAGVYNILINVATYDHETGAQMNGMNQKMEVTVVRDSTAD